jgi:signal transduction histidine kinase
MFRAPIAARLLVLVVLSVLLAQVLTIVGIMVTPPPRAPIWRVSEITQALRTGSATAFSGRRLVREFRSSPPPGQEPTPGRGLFRVGAQIAEQLGAKTEDVIVVDRARIGVFERMGMIRSGPPRAARPRRIRDLPPPPAPPVPPGSESAVPPPAPQRPDGPGGLAEGFERRLAGEFSVGWRQPDGRWAVVHPAPDHQWRLRLMTWLLAGLLLTAPLTFLFARRITSPLGRFAKAAEQLGRDPRSPPMELRGPAEVGVAAQAFNEMQARIRRYVEDRTAMVGAISHDLRTPLARIRFKLEKAAPDLKASVDADVGQMEQMIASVLAFIREVQEGRPREKIDLLSLLECVVDDAALVGGEVEIVDGHGVTIEADALALQRLFANLVDNALKYGGRAKLTLATEGGEAVVEIADEGPGLPETELERVFTPFYRAEAARTLDAGGVGLGLALARSTARAHGGDVVLWNRPEGGLTAEVRLPLA